ncbi:glycoside hydrolase superfamily [Fennellomyces sp. T-0311]|nr:glycoside hydrolase superfamily [Fennellomyces sp. T-0311]
MITITSIVLFIVTFYHGVTKAAFLQSPGLVQYWGQNSAGAAGSGQQMALSSYCDDGSTDAFIMAFINEFNVGSLPNLNLANACKDSFFPGTQLLHCPQVAQDIKSCQSKGKKILLSLGGASGSYGFQSDDQAVTFAHTLWNLFGGGSSSTRPFDDAVLDGFDLDIEGGGSTGYVTLVNTLRDLFLSDSSKQYYITAAPQCPFPDAILGSIISATGFDAVNVQFYNNYCSPSGTFNFDTWNNWATQTSPNKNVKVYLGVPGSPTAAGSGYQSPQELASVIEKVAQYSNFGGVTVWDASQAYSNTQASPNFATAVSQDVKTSGTSSASTKGGSVSSKSDSPACPATVATESDSSCTGQSGTCINNNFALCNGGKWTTMACPVGTGCLLNADSSSTSAYCGYVVAEKDTCSNPVPSSLESSQVAAQVYVGNVKHDTFDLGINAQRLDTRPFGSTVVVEMTVQPNTTITAVQGGTVSQTGRQVTLKVRNQQKKNMALRLNVSGKTGSDMALAPDARTLQFH